MSEESFDDRRASELLRLLEQDRSQVSSRRDEIRDQVLDHYDKLREIDDEVTDRVEAEVDVLEIVDDTEPTNPLRRHRHRWLAVAAAVTAIAVGGGLIVGDDPEPLVTSSTADVTTTLNRPASSISDVDGSTDLSLADGDIKFELPDGLTLVDRSEGVLVFGKSAESTGLKETIIAIEVDREGFRARLADLVGVGFINIGETGIRRVAGQEFTTWSLIPQRADLDVACAEVQGCVQLVEGVGESAVPVGIRPSVDEVVSSSGAVVLIIADADSSIRNDVAALLGIMSIS